MSIPLRTTIRSLVARPSAIRNLPRYLSDRSAWRRAGGSITATLPILNEFADSAGTAKGHYFHQDLLVASFICEANPKRHIDIGSRIDGFVAHVASFREIEVFDIRPLAQSEHSNIKFVQYDLMQENLSETADSVSCLHTIEHFGLGRYGDRIDPDGHLAGFRNIMRLVEPGGLLYISFPIGSKDQVHFNAHRVFAPDSILSWPGSEQLTLERFDWVEDAGALHMKANVYEATARFGCGIYTFRKSVS